MDAALITGERGGLSYREMAYLVASMPLAGSQRFSSTGLGRSRPERSR